MEEIIREIDIMKMDVVVLTETIKKETWENYTHFFEGVKKYESAKRGLSVLINNKWKGSIINWEPIDERMLKVEMIIWGYKLTIIRVYAPKEDNVDTVKDEERESCRTTGHSYRVDKEWRSKVTGNNHHISE
jgi:hypothetical protein